MEENKRTFRRLNEKRCRSIRAIIDLEEPDAAFIEWTNGSVNEVKQKSRV